MVLIRWPIFFFFFFIALTWCQELFKYLKHQQLTTLHQKTYDVGCVLIFVLETRCLRHREVTASEGWSWFKLRQVHAFHLYIQKLKEGRPNVTKEQDHHSPGPHSRGLAFWEFSYHLGKLVQEGASVQILYTILLCGFSMQGDRAPWSFFFFFF